MSRRKHQKRQGDRKDCRYKMPQDDIEMLKAFAKAEGKSMSLVIKEAIDTYFATKKTLQK